MTCHQEDHDNLQDQLQFPTRNREHVPMEEREARANRFVSLQVGPLAQDKQPSSSSKVLHSPLVVRPQWVKEVEAEEVFRSLAREPSVPLNVRTNQQ